MRRWYARRADWRARRCLIAIEPCLRQLLLEQCTAFGPAATPDQIQGLGQRLQARFVEVAACMFGQVQAVERDLAHTFIPEGMRQLL